MLKDDELGGRYRVLGHLGTGGSGEVWLVEHVLLNRREALKILRGVAETPEKISRFRREARVLNMLQHPNIIGVYDFGKLPDGRLYLAMEHVDGPSVGSLLRRGPLPLPRALDLLVQLAQAIEHAHERGVLHRDLKPGNLVLADTQLKVLDFGLAKMVSPDHRDSVVSTHGDGVYGTPAYLAPEQLDGVADDRRIDLYAFGCVAFEVVTGRPPFVGKPFAVLDAHLRHRPPVPSQVAPGAGIPPALDALILHCLAKKPADRIASATLLLEQLRAITPAPKDDIDATAENPLPSLRALCEALIDAGATDLELITGHARLTQLDSERRSAIDELADLERQGARAATRSREREASLRFSLGEMQFARDLAGASTPEADVGIERLERELRELVQARDASGTRLASQQRQLALAIAGASEEIDAATRGLAPIVARLRPAKAP